MTVDEFCEKHPLLFHMATVNALPQIEKHGLLSTEAILDLLGINGHERTRLIAQRRPETVVLEDSRHGVFILRDQIPMRDSALERCLVDMTIPAWYRLLNGRTFMWATRKRVETLLAARAYRKTDHLVLTIDTRRLVEDHDSDLELSPINSGSTLYNPPARGRHTFSRLSQFEAVNGRKAVAEVTVKGKIPKMREYIVDAEVRSAQG